MKISKAHVDVEEAGESMSNNLMYIQKTNRVNSLSDIEFNIIADTIRCQNLFNQMNIRLINIKRTLENS